MSHSTLLLLCGLSFFSEIAAAASASDTQKKMTRLFSSMTALLPISYDEVQFNDKKNAAQIAMALKDLAQMSHNLEADKKSLPVDPFTQMIARGLKADMEHAQKLFESGERQRSRALSRGITGYCIGCHTSSSRGAWNFPGSDSPEIGKLSSADKATYLAAVRQYDDSILYYEKALIELGANRNEKKTAEAWELAIKRMLAIIIRVQNNPFLALELISRIRETGSVPESLLQTSAQWRLAVKEWAKDGKMPPQSRQIQMNLARTLVASGMSHSTPKNPDGGLVHFLRASRIVNELLAEKKKNPDTGELLWLGGQIAEKTDDINFWDLDAGYYEACVRYQPKTELAKKCFARFVHRLSNTKIKDTKVDELRQISGT